MQVARLDLTGSVTAKSEMSSNTNKPTVVWPLESEVITECSQANRNIHIWEVFEAERNLLHLRRTVCGSEVRLHNSLTAWLAWWGVNTFPGGTAPSSSNCRPVCSLKTAESAEVGKKTGVRGTVHLSYSPSVHRHHCSYRVLTCSWRCAWLSSKQQQSRCSLGFHWPWGLGQCHGNSFGAVDLFHNRRTMALNTVELCLHWLLTRVMTSVMTSMMTSCDPTINQSNITVEPFHWHIFHHITHSLLIFPSLTLFEQRRGRE